MKGYAFSFVIFGILLSGCNLNYKKEAKKDSSIQQLIEVENEIAILQAERNSSREKKAEIAQALRRALDSGQISAKEYYEQMNYSSNREEDNQRNEKLSQLEKKRKKLKYSLEFNS